MDRRTFLTKNMPAATMGLAASRSSFALTPAEDNPMSSPYFEFFYIHMQNGSQTSRMNKWLEHGLSPICQKHGFGPIGFFNVDVGPSLPTALIVFTYPSLTEMETLWGKLNSDPDYAGVVAEVEKDEPAFYRTEAMLLRATPFCPPLVATPANAPAHNLYELRIYQSPTNRQLGYLHDRFGGGEIDVFHRSGIHPILYADTIFGPNQPNMTYLIPFDNAGQREQAWAAFRSDPEWVKIRDESIRHGGEIVRNITNMFLSPMGFSIIR